MDSIQYLINKLANAANGGEDNIALLEIVEEIKTEILSKTTLQEQPILETSSVSVMLPQGFKIKAAASSGKQLATDTSKLTAPRPPSVVTKALEPEKPVEETVFVAPTEVPIVHINSSPTVEVPKMTEAVPLVNEKIDMKEHHPVHSPWMPALTVEETLELPITDEMVHEAVALENMAKKPGVVIEPTEVESKIILEKEAPQDLNQKLAQRSQVLNEIFSKKVPVLAETLTEPRISDLRKAISINEKYQYIDTLFRGDEQMFERSIKTLNNFDILPEAQYWMQRELLIKLGWNDEDELVQRFFSLVSRRFS